jgi:hypothetical protein
MTDRWSETLALALAGLSATWSVVIGVVILFRPMSYVEEPGHIIIHRPFLSVSMLGPAPLLIPILIAALAVRCVRRRARVGFFGTALLMVLFCFVTGFSIGSSYLPAAALLLLAILPAAFQPVRN